MQQELINVALADDQTLFLRGLALLLESIEGVHCIFQVNNGQELLEQLSILQPDVILLDLQMPVMTGLEALGIIKERYEHIKVILLTMHDDERLIQQVLEMGANGYLLKNEEPKEIERAIRSVMEKDFYLNDYVSKALFKGAQKSQKPKLESVA